MDSDKTAEYREKFRLSKAFAYNTFQRSSIYIDLCNNILKTLCHIAFHAVYPYVYLKKIQLPRLRW